MYWLRSTISDNIILKLNRDKVMGWTFTCLYPEDRSSVENDLDLITSSIGNTHGSQTRYRWE